MLPVFIIVNLVNMLIVMHGLHLKTLYYVIGQWPVLFIGVSGNPATEINMQIYMNTDSAVMHRNNFKNKVKT